MKTSEDKEYITRAGLKLRGWTPKIIKSFIFEPDVITKNPYYKAGPPMLLYSFTKILEIENSSDFVELKNKTEKIKQSSKKAVETKLNKLKNYLNDIKFYLPILDQKDLYEKSITHFNEFQEFKQNNYNNYQDRDYKEANLGSDPSFLCRIAVNYLRHQLTDYEEELFYIKGKVGFAFGYKEIKNKIFDLIIYKYPYLKNECEKQRIKLNENV